MANAGLHPQTEHPEEFNHVLLEFLKSGVMQEKAQPRAELAAV
jgi:hypothetical protein